MERHYGEHSSASHDAVFGDEIVGMDDHVRLDEFHKALVVSPTALGAKR
jgi:hypothetical protein